MVDINSYKSDFQSSISRPDNKKRNLIIVAISAVVVMCIALLSIWILSFFGQNSRVDAVKSQLDTAYDSMERKKQLNGAYPSSLADVLVSSNSDIKISGSTSFDGSAYCIDAKDSKDESITFHIDQSVKSGEYKSGMCQANESDSKPTTPGGLAVAYTSANSIKINWRPAMYAKSYVLQCSTDNKFAINTELKTDDTNAVCDGLKKNTKYYYKVMAVGESGNSDWSSVGSISTSP